VGMVALATKEVHSEREENNVVGSESFKVFVDGDSL
jgi:hypothetical protein